MIKIDSFNEGLSDDIDLTASLVIEISKKFEKITDVPYSPSKIRHHFLAFILLCLDV